MAAPRFLLSDAALVRRARADDLEALEALVLRYERRAHAIARALGIGADVADDVVQQAFLEALEGLASLRAPEAFGGWFLVIVRNLARKQLRRDLHAPRSEPQALAAVEARAERSLEAREAGERLREAVERLPEGIREAIYLHYYEGASTRAAARALGISRTAVKSRLLRGRDLLRGELWRELGDSVRREAPPARAWRQRARRLTLLLAAALRPREGAGASGGAAVAGGSGAASLSVVSLQGGLLMMAGKKVIALLAAAAVLIAAAGLLHRSLSRPDRSPDVSGGTLAARGDAAAGAPPSRDAEADGAPAVAAAGAPAPGIAGTVFLEVPPAPAAGAHVIALREDGGKPAGSAAADAGGHYELRGLAQGRYLVWAWKEEWSCGDAPSAWTAVAVEEGRTASGIDRTLVPGVILRGVVLEASTRAPIAAASVRFARWHATETRADGTFDLEGVSGGLTTVRAQASGFAPAEEEIDVAPGEEPGLTFLLAPAGVIEGKVRDPGGAPAVGARVQADERERYLAASAVAGDEGRFRLEGIALDARDIDVTAFLENGATAAVKLPGFPPGEDRIACDLELRDGFRLRGRAVDAAGQPVAGAAIHLLGSLVFPPGLETDAGGRFEVDGATERVFFLSAHREGLAPATLDLRELAPSGRDSIELVLEAGGSVAGAVVDAAGLPIDGARVSVEVATPLAGPEPAGETDARGRFRIDGLPPRLDGIRASKRGYAFHRSSPVEPGRSDLRLVLAEAGRIDGVAVDQADGKTPGALLVKVTAAEGPFREKNIEKGYRGGLLSSFGEEGLPFDLGNGAFHIRHGLAAGIYYRVVVLAEGYEAAVLDGVEAWPLSAERPPLRVELRRGTELRGRVVDARTGEGLEAVRLQAVPAEALRRSGKLPWDTRGLSDGVAAPAARSDAEGRFALRGLGGGAALLLLDRTGYARLAIHASTAPGGEQRIELEPEAVIEGSARDGAGAPIAGASVDVGFAGLAFPRAAETGTGGTFRVGGLPAGEADVVLRHQAWPDKHRTVALRPGETATLEFQGGRGVLAGRLTRGGEPVAGAGIHIKGLGGAGEQVWATAGDDGRFRQGGLEPGRYEVGWRLPGDASFLSGPGREVVEVGEGETVIDLEAAVPGRLGGRVVRAGTGEAVAGAEVTLQTDGAELFARGGFRVPGGFWLPAAKATSDAAGRFEFAVSARGRCFLNAAAAGVQGWLGPFDLEPAALPGELEIEIGGAGRLDATVIDEGTGGAVGGALVIIKSEADVPIRVAAKTDATGRASLEAIRPGAYRLEVQASASITWRERLVLGEEPVARTVRLEPASWIVLELGGGSDPARRAPPGNLIVAATALEGPDPIWNLLSVEGERPREMANFSFDAGGRLRARLKTRAGKYRLAIEVHRDGTHLPPLGREEVEIEVPRGGEVLHRIADSWTRGL